MTVTFIDYTNPDGSVTTFAIIAWGNDEYTSMTKAEYDKEYPNGINEAKVK
jgi:hypothetical protein